jgi:hypothetical protein
MLSELSSAVVPETTNQGCTCKSTCGATLTEGFANCDWCYTEGSCGKRGLTGRWDFCKYPEVESYENQTASAKVNELWSQIIAEQTSGPTTNPAGILAQGIQTSFDNARDVVPAGREKGIHSVGTICKFDFAVANDSPYTGLLAPGSKSEGLLRMGPALEVTKSSGLVPGLGIKLLRGGVPSGNFVALVTLNPLDDDNYNFFSEDFSNHIPTADTLLTKSLVNKFKQGSSCPNKVGLSDLTAFDANGAKADSNVFPFKLAMRPNWQIENVPMEQAELMNKLTEVPVNVALFDIFAYESPTAAPQKIGSFVPNDSCVTSQFGDADFFIRHQRIEEDWALRPEWLPLMDPREECDLSSFTTVPPQMCSEM